MSPHTTSEAMITFKLRSTDSQICFNTLQVQSFSKDMIFSGPTSLISGKNFSPHDNRTTENFEVQIILKMCCTALLGQHRFLGSSKNVPVKFHPKTRRLRARFVFLPVDRRDHGAASEVNIRTPYITSTSCTFIRSQVC